MLAKGRKMKNTLKIEIMNPCLTPRLPVGMLKDLQHKRCCLSTLRFRFKGQVYSNIYFSNEIVEIDFEYDDTQGYLDLKSVIVSLIRVIVLKNDQGEATKQSKMLKQKALNPVSRTQNQIKYLTQMSLKDIDNSLAVTKSIVSKLISCKYYLNITHVLSGCCTNPLPYIEVEIIIFPDKAILEAPIIESPADWNPQSFPLARLSLSGGIEPSAPLFEYE